VFLKISGDSQVAKGVKSDVNAHAPLFDAIKVPPTYSVSPALGRPLTMQSIQNPEDVCRLVDGIFEV